MTLRTLFAIPIAIILLVTLSLAGMITVQTWFGLERGRAAVNAVERMRILLLLQTNLANERITANIVLAAPFPLQEAASQRLTAVRRDTDERIESLAIHFPFADKADAGVIRPPSDLLEVLVKLGKARAAIDALLAVDRPERSFEALNALVPQMLAASQALERPLKSAAHDIIAADPSVSGLLVAAHLASSLRDELSRVAWAMMPRFNKGEKMTPAEVAEAHRRMTVARELTFSVEKAIEILGPTDKMRQAIGALRQMDEGGELWKLDEIMAAGPRLVGDDAGILPPQRILIPWGDRIAVVRAAIVETIVSRVTREQAARENRLRIVLLALGVVVIAVLQSVTLLSRRVVRPLAQLGLAITRIAGGDRTSPLTMRPATREIAGMVTAVETLRQAALVADDAALRQRLAARQRLEMLHEAMGIAQTVREPAHALERGVASLSDGIDATIALVSTATTPAPPTLGVAARAVRVGLADMRDSTAAFEATFGVGEDHMEDPPEAEFVARILAVRTRVERCDEAVRAFIQPSLVALRDAASVDGQTPAPVLRELVSDQFLRIEATVAMLAAMRDAVARAMAILRGLALEPHDIAA